MIGEGGLTGELGRLVGKQEFYSWDSCTMVCMNMHSDWICL